MYEAFYKLSSKPFQLNPDPRFFFGSRTHKRAMSYLRYGLTQGEGFIVITGGVGTGKTTLVRSLFADLAKENIVAAQLVTTNLKPEDTVRMVAASFGLAHEGTGKAQVIKNLETFFLARAREGKRILLVVDEAQNLPMESLNELRMLANFQISGRALLQSFLLGQQELRNTLQDDSLEQVRQRIIAAYHLDPLDKEETKAYIEHRLKLVDWHEDPRFTASANSAIYDFTQGVPRRINTFCDRLLLFGYLEQLHNIDAPQVREVSQELRQERPIHTTTPQEPIPEIEPAPTPPPPKKDIGITHSMEHQQLDAMEARIAILEERIDILERAFRRQLESARRS